jgi:thiamine pyrophosphate-dependent acetolactate synthase large subunit-like protein
VHGRCADFGTEPLDVPALARSLGAEAAVAAHPGDILALDIQGRCRRRPLLVDVHIDPAVPPPLGSRVQRTRAASGTVEVDTG